MVVLAPQEQPQLALQPVLPVLPSMVLSDKIRP